MQDDKIKVADEIADEETQTDEIKVEADEGGEKPLDKNVKLMSPTQMVLRRFFRSKLSVAGLIMLISLMVFCWLGPLVYTRGGETETDRDGKTEYTAYTVTTEDGEFIE